MITAATDSRPVVLVVRLSALGDVAMSAGVVSAAARLNPGIRFVVVTRPAFASFFPDNIEVIGTDLKGRHKGVRGMARLASELWSHYHPAAIADMHDVIRTKILRSLLRLRGVRVASIDKGRRDKKLLLSGKHRHQLPHSTERYTGVLRTLGYETGHPDASPLGPHIPSGRPSVGIAPFAAHPGKAYPLEKMIEAAALIRSARPDAKILWFSAPGNEAGRLSELTPESDIIVANLGLNGGIGAEIELMASLDVMIAMDSGNMHLAALRGVPTVSVWGATHPYAGFAGATSPDSLRIQADMSCRPCSVYGNRPCRLTSNGTFPCLDAISPAEIAARTLSLIPSR